MFIIFGQPWTLYGLRNICGVSQVPNPTSQQPEELSEADKQMFNLIAAGIAYGPVVWGGLVIGHIFASHDQDWFVEIKVWSKKTHVATSAVKSISCNLSNKNFKAYVLSKVLLIFVLNFQDLFVIVIFYLIFL